ncbi:hypothetical protein BC828DRAFT_401931 [Blastocladiella britannica]|nr:hypothetical protein BC828DRAFT_401931 [Blastocladiella britannica]
MFSSLATTSPTPVLLSDGWRRAHNAPAFAVCARAREIPWTTSIAATSSPGTQLVPPRRRGLADLDDLNASLGSSSSHPASPAFWSDSSVVSTVFTWQQPDAPYHEPLPPGSAFSIVYRSHNEILARLCDQQPQARARLLRSPSQDMQVYLRFRSAESESEIQIATLRLTPAGSLTATPALGEYHTVRDPLQRRAFVFVVGIEPTSIAPQSTHANQFRARLAGLKQMLLQLPTPHLTIAPPQHTSPASHTSSPSVGPPWVVQVNLSNLQFVTWPAASMRAWIDWRLHVPDGGWRISQYGHDSFIAGSSPCVEWNPFATEPSLVVCVPIEAVLEQVVSDDELAMYGTPSIRIALHCVAIQSGQNAPIVTIGHGVVPLHLDPASHSTNGGRMLPLTVDSTVCIHRTLLPPHLRFVEAVLGTPVVDFGHQRAKGATVLAGRLQASVSVARWDPKRVGGAGAGVAGGGMAPGEELAVRRHSEALTRAKRRVAELRAEQLAKVSEDDNDDEDSNDGV